MRTRICASIIALCGIAWVVGGCGSGEQKPNTETKDKVSGEPSQAPYRAGKSSATTADLKSLQAARSDAKQALDASPQDENTKAAYVEATVKLATATMMAPELDKKVKYKDALRLYREALKFDPANKVAKSNSKMIEDIYLSLGRPIPQ